MAFHPTPSTLWSEGDEQRILVRQYINETLRAILDGFCLGLSEGRPSITLRRRLNATDTEINPRTGALETTHQFCASRLYTWPADTALETWKFSLSLGRSHLLKRLTDHQIYLQPDIFYIDPVYFRSQGAVDDAIDDLAFTIGVDRAALGVEAAGKGLIAGTFCLKHDSEVIVDARIGSQSTLVPRVQDGDEIDITGTRWVLVIEKEFKAVFQRLMRSGFHNNALAGNGILITGKGYPDLLSRRLTRHIFDMACTSQPKPRFYALVDADPDGIAIMSTYKYGSLSHVHENAKLCIPGLQWLGLRISDIIDGESSLGQGGSSPLTARDRRKIITMLRNSPVWAVDGPELEWRVELQRMLLLNAKAEIEMLYEQSDGLEGWIERRMFRQA
ncbi:hypothetical protein N7492_000506 [Penicillium capsulatum]|uniref:DNA topoisomerase (ATP-hydrolyzing) n=1 Tax=Penicillium capsulatum TaxID=69766 RepID=A0A9W9LZ14_9EURO|nr:hypothetical protein N7492_000506 [Penicillium capsulatum]KAJ6130436.1 hypothetical protein N7512_003216 [Penicillium capsulatum]